MSKITTVALKCLLNTEILCVYQVLKKAGFLGYYLKSSAVYKKLFWHIFLYY